MRLFKFTLRTKEIAECVRVLVGTCECLYVSVFVCEHVNVCVCKRESVCKRVRMCASECV